MTSFRNPGPQGLAPLSALNADSLRTTVPFEPEPARVTPLSDPAIEALQLAPVARAAAYALKRAHPSVIFTSGRRGKQDQARAMASNVVQNRGWIRQTYLCQCAVQQVPGLGRRVSRENLAGRKSRPACCRCWIGPATPNWPDSATTWREWRSTSSRSQSMPMQ